MSDVPEVITLFSSPVAILVLAYMQFRLKDEVASLKDSIHNNGFVRRDTLDERLKSVDRRLERLEDTD